MANEKVPDLEIFVRNKYGFEENKFFLSEKLLTINWSVFEHERTRDEHYESENELIEKALRTILYLGGEFIKLGSTVECTDIITINKYYIISDKTFIVNENKLLKVTMNNKEKILSEYPCFYALVEDINKGKEIIMEYSFKEEI